MSTSNSLSEMPCASRRAASSAAIARLAKLRLPCQARNSISLRYSCFAVSLDIQSRSSYFTTVLNDHSGFGNLREAHQNIWAAYAESLSSTTRAGAPPRPTRSRPMQFGVMHFFAGGTKENYEASIAAVHPGPGRLPAGQLFHIAVPTPGGWTIVAVHESKGS